jgi:hypothetical protein
MLVVVEVVKEVILEDSQHLEQVVAAVEAQVDLLIRIQEIMEQLTLVAAAVVVLLMHLHHLKVLVVLAVPVSSSSLTHHNKYLKNHNGIRNSCKFYHKPKWIRHRNIQ